MTVCEEDGARFRLRSAPTRASLAFRAAGVVLPSTVRAAQLLAQISSWVGVVDKAGAAIKPANGCAARPRARP